VNQEFGITGCSGHPPTIHCTSDGGQSWTRSDDIPG
jgi:hypothetical protein